MLERSYAELYLLAGAILGLVWTLLVGGSTPVCAQNPTTSPSNPIPLDITVARDNFAKSPTQDVFAIGTEDGTIILWDAQAHATVRELDGRFELQSDSLTWSPNGRLIAANSLATLIWEAETGELLPSWTGCCEVGYGIPEGVSHLAFSPNSTLLAKGGALFDVETGEVIHRLFESVAVDGFSFRADGTVVAADPVAFGPAMFWDVRTGERLYQIGPTSTLAFSPDGTMIAVDVNMEVSPPYLVNVLESQSYEVLQSFEVAFIPYQLAWTPDSRILFVGVEDWSWLSDGAISSGFTVYSWNVETGQPGHIFGITRTMEILYPLSDSEMILNVGDSFSPDWALVLNTETREMYSITPLSGDTPTEIEVTDDRIEYFALSPNGELLATVTASGAAVIWNVETGERLWTLAEEGVAVARVIWLSDGETIATVAPDGEVLFWGISSDAAPPCS